MKYDQIPQPLNINLITPGANGLQAVGGALVAFTACQAAQTPNYGVPMGTVPQTLPAVAGVGQQVTVATPGRAARSQNLITCALVTYIYTNGGGAIQQVHVYHAHTGFIPAADLPMGANFVPGFAAANVHVVFATSQDDNPGVPLAGVQTASSGLFGILASGIPAANIRIVLSTMATYGANLQGDVGRAPEQMFDGNDLPNRILQACMAAGGRAAGHPGALGPGFQLRNQALQGVLGAQMAAAHGHARDLALFQALTAFMAPVINYPVNSFDLFFVDELNTQIWGGAALPVNPGNAAARLQATMLAIEVGVRQLA